MVSSRWWLGLLLLLNFPATAFLVSPSVRFEDVAEGSGIRFLHYNGASPEKYVVETMGSGAAFLDFDNDGWLDVFLVNGGAVPGHPPPGPLRHGLFRNRRDGSFQDVTQDSGLGELREYGMGAACADYDGDGWTDLLVTGLGGNRLYRNVGGRFRDVTAEAGVRGEGWNTSAAWLDFDRDGRLDLFVARYVDFRYDNNIACGDLVRQVRAYCHPDVYDGVSSLLFRNNGDGTFSDVSRPSGIQARVGKSLGVVAADLDLDGWVDLYVANDSVANFLFRNRGDGTFEEVGTEWGVAFDEGGKPQAGMGTSLGDFDGDGRPDLIVTNLDRENNNLYQNLGSYFVDVGFRNGFAPPSLPLVGWGTGFFDYDNDGDLDVLVVNGHVIDNIELFRPEGSYRQPFLLLENQEGRFREVSRERGADLTREVPARGAAFGDVDNDGDLDVLVSTVGGPPLLLRNQGGNGMNWLLLQLEGTRSPRHPVGTRVVYLAGGKKGSRWLAGGGSYLSSHDQRLHLGLGEARRLERLEIFWPSGEVQVLEGVESNRCYQLREGDPQLRACPGFPGRRREDPGGGLPGWPETKE